MAFPRIRKVPGVTVSVRRGWDHACRFTRVIDSSPINPNVHSVPSTNVVRIRTSTPRAEACHGADVPPAFGRANEGWRSVEENNMENRWKMSERSFGSEHQRCPYPDKHAEGRGMPWGRRSPSFRARERGMAFSRRKQHGEQMEDVNRESVKSRVEHISVLNDLCWIHVPG